MSKLREKVSSQESPMEWKAMERRQVLCLFVVKLHNRMSLVTRYTKTRKPVWDKLIGSVQTLNVITGIWLTMEP